MSSLTLSGLAVACILSGVMLGIFLRKTLPGHHLSPDTKDVVRLALV
jgi:hypothetical protein